MNLSDYVRAMRIYRLKRRLGREKIKERARLGWILIGHHMGQATRRDGSFVTVKMQWYGFTRIF